MSVVVTGNFDMGASLTVADGVVLKTSGEGLLENGTVTGEITLSGDAVLEMSSSAAQTMNGKITVAQAGHGYVITKPGSDVSFNSSKAASWELRVAGNSYVDDYRTLPTAESCLEKRLQEAGIPGKFLHLSKDGSTANERKLSSDL